MTAHLLAALLAAGAPPDAGPFQPPQSEAQPSPFPTTLVDQGKFDPRLRGILLPDGFRAEIAADAPAVVNPVGLTFAPDGTLFVLEWAPDPGREWYELHETVRYKDGSTRRVATMKKFVTDPVKVMHRRSDGTYLSATQIIAEELPSTLLWHDGWLYTASRGTVRRYKQSQPGGKWDVRETVAQGFCGFHHHQVSGLTIGNDGLLYITSGDDDNVAEGADGSRATALRTGAVFRCKPDGSNLELFSLGYRNPYRDLAFDQHFNWFHADNDNEDGSKFTGCRLVNVVEAADFGWRLYGGARCCRPDFARGAVGGELPGKLAPMLKTGRGSPAGLCIPNDTRIPERFRGLLLYPDVFRKVVRAYAVRPKGSTFEVAGEFDFMKSDDGLFRPCQMTVGPDGALYVCDWRADSGGAGKLWGDAKHGRIYRIRWAGTADEPAIPLRGMDSWAKLLKLPTEQLVDALDSDDFTDRVEARKELVRRGPAARDVVLRRLVSGGLEPDGRLVALGVLDANWSADAEELFRVLLNDTNADVRRLAVDALGRHAKKGDARTQEALLKALGDGSPAVRRVAALAVGRVGAAGAPELLLSAWKADDGEDPYLADAFLRGVEATGAAGAAALLALAESGEGRDLARAVEAFRAARAPAMAEALPRLLGNPHLSAAQRADLVRSFPNYLFEPPLSPEPLVAFLASRPGEPAEVQLAGLDVLAAVGGFGTPRARQFAVGLLESPSFEVRLAAIRAAEDARLTDAGPKLLAILNDAKKPEAERLASLKALRTAGAAGVAPALAALLERPEASAFQVEALRALAAASPAEGRKAAEALLGRPDAALLAEAVRVLGATSSGAVLVGERFAAGKLPKELLPAVSEALAKFAADPAAAALRGQVLKGGLSLADDPAAAERVRKLVFTQGNAQRGKELYLNPKVLACASCHRMEGFGGQVGPDLTRVWETQTLDKLLESIVSPSKEIKEGYQTYRAATADGRVLTGLRVSESPTEVVLREANGQDARLKKDELEEFAPLKTSLMPDNAAAQLTFEQFLDLLAFLKSQKAQESLRGK